MINQVRQVPHLSPSANAKETMNATKALLATVISLLVASLALATDEPKPEALPAGQNMYVIERVIPGASKLSAEELKAISQKSCAVLHNLGPQIQWLHSYVTADKIYCVYLAPSEKMVREHAKQGGFPANSVSKVTTIISPATAGN
jgi:uncharacterized protein DUF4242